MARLILLSISMFLLLALVCESSIAWPYPEDEDTITGKAENEDDGEALSNLEDINEQTVKNQDDRHDKADKEEVGQEQEEDELDADIEHARLVSCRL